MITFKHISKNQKLCALIITIISIVVIVFVISNAENLLSKKTIRIENMNNKIVNDNNENNEAESEAEDEMEINLINGIKCENAERRPFAVMLAGDLEAWPLSSISQADLVVEMPVVTGGITRYMAIYICDNPKEIGSIRSARHDFIPLAIGFDAILAHWGGSHYALDKLNNKIMDNVNALYLDGSVFYRKPGLPKPHDGFTTIERLEEYSERMGYRLESNFNGYKFHEEENPSDKNGLLTVGYYSIYKVDYEYNAGTNLYLRSKGNKEDTDKLDSKQIAVKNVVIMFAASRQIEGQYNDMDIEGEGKAIVYQDGREVKGTWQKDKSDMKSKLYFYDESGKEIKFVPGKIWIQIVEPGQKVEWEVK